MRNSVLVVSIAVVVVVAVVAPFAAAANRDLSYRNGGDYHGQFLAYGTTDNAIIDYKVDGTTMMESMQVQSASSAGIGLDGALSGVTSIVGAKITGLTTAETSATVKFESGARMQTHDNGHGILVLESGGRSQVVQANLSSESDTSKAGNNRVVVTTGDGSKGTFIVVGEGNVAVNEGGNVTARVGQNGRLIYRTYPQKRTSSDEDQERLIANGTAVGELYVQDGGQDGDGGQQGAVDVVSYSEATTIEAKNRTERSVTYTAQRSEGQGKVFITSVTEAYGSADDVNVTVDGEAAARAQSYSDLVAATKGGGQSKYLVSQSSSAQTSMDVVVAVNKFSTREVTVSGAEDGGGGSGVGIPGFGIGLALLALAGAILLGRARR